MTERWVVLVAPRGDVLRLDDRYNEYHDDASLFGLSLQGRFDDGRAVTIRGTHVALAWKEPLECGPQIPGQITVHEALEETAA